MARPKKKTDSTTLEDPTILNKLKFAGYDSLITDLRNENVIPANGTWDYVCQVAVITATPNNYRHIGSYLYYDGPMVAKSSGPEPSYRKIIYVSADWETEKHFANLMETLTYVRILLMGEYETYRRHPYIREGTTNVFRLQGISTIAMR